MLSFTVLINVYCLKQLFKLNLFVYISNSTTFFSIVVI